MPGTTASAKARTTPQELRGVWIRSIGDSGFMQYHIGKNTFWVNYGMYNSGKWDRNGGRTVKLGSKVKKNKMFTLSKKNKKGYRTLKYLLSNDDSGKMKLKKVKVNKKVRLKITDVYGETHNYFKVTKHWEVKNDMHF